MEREPVKWSPAEVGRVLTRIKTRRLVYGKVWKVYNPLSLQLSAFNEIALRLCARERQLLLFREAIFEWPLLLFQEVIKQRVALSYLGKPRWRTATRLIYYIVSCRVIEVYFFTRIFFFFKLFSTSEHKVFRLTRCNSKLLRFVLMNINNPVIKIYRSLYIRFFFFFNNVSPRSIKIYSLCAFFSCLFFRVFLWTLFLFSFTRETFHACTRVIKNVKTLKVRGSLPP